METDELDEMEVYESSRDINKPQFDLCGILGRFREWPEDGWLKEAFDLLEDEADDEPNWSIEDCLDAYGDQHKVLWVTNERMSKMPVTPEQEKIYRDYEEFHAKFVEKLIEEGKTTLEYEVLKKNAYKQHFDSTTNIINQIGQEPGVFVLNARQHFFFYLIYNRCSAKRLRWSFLNYGLQFIETNTEIKWTEDLAFAAYNSYAMDREKDNDTTTPEKARRLEDGADYKSQAQQ